MSDESEGHDPGSKQSWAEFRQWASAGWWSYNIEQLWAGCACAVVFVTLSQLGVFGGPQLGWNIAVFAIAVTACTTWFAYRVFTRKK